MTGRSFEEELRLLREQAERMYLDLSSLRRRIDNLQLTYEAEQVPLPEAEEPERASDVAPSPSFPAEWLAHFATPEPVPPTEPGRPTSPEPVAVHPPLTPPTAPPIVPPAAPPVTQAPPADDVERREAKRSAFHDLHGKPAVPPAQPVPRPVPPEQAAPQPVPRPAFRPVPRREPSAPPPPPREPSVFAQEFARLMEALPFARKTKAERAKETGGDDRLEMRIGGVWFNRVGALVILIAIALLVKLSIDKGWFTETWRVCSAAGLGLVLVGIGEFSLRKNLRVFATGLLGCGIAVLYLSAFGAHKYYGLVGQGTASVLYTVVTALSAGIAIHARLLPVAVMGLLGGLGTPLLLGTGEDKQAELLTYLLALDTAFLAAGSIRKWDILRAMAWAGTALLFGAWAVTFFPRSADAVGYADIAWRTAGFLLAFYVLFHAEVMISLRRGSVGNSLVAGVLVAFNSPAFFACTYFALRHVAPGWMGALAVLAGGLQWLSAWKLAGPSEIGWRVRRALWLTGAGMLALAAPLQFDRYLVGVSWSIQAVITLWFCRRYTDELWLRLKGGGLIAAAVGHLLVYEYRDPEMLSTVASIGLWKLNWLIACGVFMGLAACGGSAALLIRRLASRVDRSLAGVLVVGGTLLVMGIFLQQWDRYVAGWWWVGIGVAWALVALRVPAAGALSAMVAVLALAKFVTYDTLMAVSDASWSGIRGIGLNRVVMTGAAVGVLAIVARRALRRMPELPKMGRLEVEAEALGLLGVAVFTWAATFEVFRAFRFEPWILETFSAPQTPRGIFLTCVWALNAAVLWLLPTVRRSPQVTAFAVLLSLMAVARFMLLDTLAFAADNEWTQLSGIVLNRQFLVGLVLIGMVMLAAWRLHVAREAGQTFVLPAMPAVALVLGLLLFVWATTFEVSRMFAVEAWFRERYAGAPSAVAVHITALWAVIAAGLWVLPRRWRSDAVLGSAVVLSVLVMLRMLGIDLLLSSMNGNWKELSGLATNRQFVVGLMVIGLGLLMYRRVLVAIAERQRAVLVPVFARALLVGVLLLITCVPTFEVARAFRFEPWFVKAYAEAPHAAGVHITALWALIAAGLWLVPRAWRGEVVLGFAVVLSVTTMLRLFGVDLVGASIKGDWSELSGVVLNRQFVVGLMVIGLGLLTHHRVRAVVAEGGQRLLTPAFAGVLMVLALLLIVCVPTFEVARVFRFEPWFLKEYAGAPHATGVHVTALWALIAAGLWMLPRARRGEVVLGFAVVLSTVTMLRMLAVDLVHASTSGHWSELAGLCVNRQFVVGLMVIGLGLLTHRRVRSVAEERRRPLLTTTFARALLVLTLLLITWVPTFEVARAFRFDPLRERFTDPMLARHAAISVMWGINAVGLLVVGFARMSVTVRYFGLALFAVTVGKIFLVDLSHLDLIYRIVSFMAVGVLLMFASYLYQRRFVRPPAVHE